MVSWSSSGNLLFAVSAVVEAIATFSIGTYSTSESIIIAAILLIVPSFVVGYFAGQLGIVYGLILGLMPAFFGIAQLPSEVLDLSPTTAAVVLFVAYVLASGLSGASGTALARWRDAA